MEHSHHWSPHQQDIYGLASIGVGFHSIVGTKQVMLFAELGIGHSSAIAINSFLVDGVDDAVGGLNHGYVKHRNCRFTQRI